MRGVVAEWLDPSTPDTTGNDVFLVAFNHLRNGSLAYVHYLLRCNDGYGLTELTQLERLRVTDLAQLKKRMVSKGAIPDEPLLRYVATFVCTGGLGVRARKFKDFSFDLCYFLELLKGGDWDTMPHYQALVEPFYSCRAGLGTTQTSEEVHAKLVGKVFDPDVVHDHNKLRRFATVFGLMLQALGMHYTGEYSWEWHMERTVASAELV